MLSVQVSFVVLYERLYVSCMKCAENIGYLTLSTTSGKDRMLSETDCGVSHSLCLVRPLMLLVVYLFPSVQARAGMLWFLCCVSDICAGTQCKLQAAKRDCRAQLNGWVRHFEAFRWGDNVREDECSPPPRDSQCCHSVFLLCMLW